MTSKSSARLIVSDFFVLTFLHSHRLGNWWGTKSCGTAAALSWIKPKVSTKRLQLLTHSASFGTNCSFDPRLAFLMRHCPTMAFISRIGLYQSSSCPLRGILPTVTLKHCFFVSYWGDFIFFTSSARSPQLKCSTIAVKWLVLGRAKRFAITQCKCVFGLRSAELEQTPFCSHLNGHVSCEPLSANGPMALMAQPHILQC